MVYEESYNFFKAVSNIELHHFWGELAFAVLAVVVGAIIIGFLLTLIDFWIRKKGQKEETLLSYFIIGGIVTAIVPQIYTPIHKGLVYLAGIAFLYLIYKLFRKD